MAADDYASILVTCPDEEVAARIARTLVEEKLAACVNIVPQVRSIYRWKSELQDDREALCIIKTRRALYEAVRTRVEALHPYKVPEIMALPFVAGNSEYLAWLAQQTREPS